MGSRPESPVAASHRSDECPLCARVAGAQHRDTSGLAAAIEDGFPVSPGHALIVPVRHVADFFGLEEEEIAAITRLVVAVMKTLRDLRNPDGFNVGLNCGEAAGQTVDHVHVHVIPRFEGDSPDPRGGVRWVLPDKAPYWDQES